MILAPDPLFSLANTVVLLGWGLLIIAPRLRVTQVVVLNGVLPLLLAVAYAVLIGSHYLGPHAADGGFNSLAEVAALFRDPWGLLAGWVHYLCFDLGIGIWESLDARRRGVPHLLLIPCLLLTFLFGPVGLLLYSMVRRFYGQPVAASLPSTLL